MFLKHFLLLFHSISIEGTCNFDFKDLWLYFLLIRAFKNLDDLCSLFKSTVVDPVLKPQSTSSAPTSTNTDRVRGQRSRLEEEDPLRVPPRRPPYRDTGGWYVRLELELPSFALAWKKNNLIPFILKKQYILDIDVESIPYFIRKY